MIKNSDMLGKKYGRWLLLSVNGRNKYGYELISCRCECGTEKDVQKRLIISGSSKSCGCSIKNYRKDLKGKKFGRLTVLKFSHVNSGSYWVCQCSCGTIKPVKGTSLTTKKIVSCGCYKDEKVSERFKTHGYTVNKIPKEYRSWAAMNGRCYNKNNKSYHNYGGRGISVCDRWRNSFENFINDMGESGEGLSIERIDNNKGYSPENCKWATKKEQANNRRTNIIYECEGKRLNVKQWSEIKGIGYWNLINRIKHLNWPIEKALNHPLVNK